MFKLHRFELVVLLAALAALAAAIFLFTGRLAALDLSRCGERDCTALIEERSSLERLSLPLQELANVLPAFAGMVLGVALVGREIEHNTATFSWSLVLSRTRWLAERLLIIGLLLLTGTALAALGTEALSAAVHPGINLARSFTDADGRGVIVIERAAIALMVGVVIGTLLGRPLPALLATIVASAGLLLLLQVGQAAWLRAEAVRLDAGGRVVDPLADRIIEMQFQTPTGALLTYPEARAQLDDSGRLPEDVYVPIPLGIPADRYLEVTARDAAVSLAVFGILLASSMVAVEHRRPY